jgi:oligosaccharide repeat unit polymerase
MVGRSRGRKLSTSSDLVAEIAPYAALVTAAIGIGFVIAALNLGGVLASPLAVSELVLSVTGVAGLVALRVRRVVILRHTGPGVHIAASALGFVFLFGLLAGRDQLLGHGATIAALFGLAVVAFLVGAAFGVVVWGVRLTRVTVSLGVDALRSPLARLVICGLTGVAVLNLATGAIPLFSANIDAARFVGNGGILGNAWTWVIGGLEWIVVVMGVRCFASGRGDRYSSLTAALSTGILVLLAGRSFVIIVALALVVAFAVLRGLPPSRLVVLVVIGLAFLGAAGKYRSEHSATMGQSPASRSSYSAITRSAGTGPAVFATVLNQVPQFVPYQHGAFVLRDLRAMLPFHPFGRPESADSWVTRVLRGRNSTVVGGSPPTLVGGLYIDFGVGGVVVGAALLGLALTLIYRWAGRAQTLGAVTLYGYTTAYVALSGYSYVSIKPAVVTAVALSVGLHMAERPRSRSRARTQPTGHLGRERESDAG